MKYGRISHVNDKHNDRSAVQQFNYCADTVLLTSIYSVASARPLPNSSWLCGTSRCSYSKLQWRRSSSHHGAFRSIACPQEVSLPASGGRDNFSRLAASIKGNLNVAHFAFALSLPTSRDQAATNCASNARDTPYHFGSINIACANAVQ